ncbi:MAG: glycosyltransferase family 39 protein [Pirellulales bacterium]
MSSTALADSPTEMADRPTDRIALPAGRWCRRLLVLNGLALIAVAVFFRVWKLDHVPGINGDEAWSGVLALSFLSGEPIAWRTPTGNLLNIFYLGPLAALHACFPPSFLLLRIVAVASGLAALVANYRLARRAFGARTAAVSTLLLAVLPINLAYSRFGWDASQSLLATVLVMYPALTAGLDSKHQARWIIMALAAFAAAVLVHPTNVFTAPLVAVPLCWQGRALVARRLDPRRARLTTWLPAWTFLGLASGLALWIARHWIAVACHRLIEPRQVLEFVTSYVRLFSGVTVYRYIPGSRLPHIGESTGWGLDLDPYDLATALVAGFVALGLYRAIRRARPATETCLLVGWAATAVAFFLIAGPRGLMPHFERYGICLIAPAAVLLARGAVEWLETPGQARWTAILFAAVAWCMLGGFYLNYFRFFEQTGGRSQATFRTGPTEPKLAAFRLLASDRRPAQPLHILAGEWWNYWPLRYLAFPDPEVRVETWDETWDAPRFREAFRDPAVRFVEFADGMPGHDLKWLLTDGGFTFREEWTYDYAGQPVISVLQVTGRER